METKNTLENKVKFFAQYWGQTYFITAKEVGFIKEKVGSVIWEKRVEDSFIDIKCCLELKSLSSISDDNLEIIIKILLGKELIQPLKIDRVEKEYDDDDDVFIVVRYLLRDAEEWQNCNQIEQYITISHNTIKNQIGYIRENGTGITDLDLWNAKYIFDKLTQLGYSLPWNGITIEEQIEFGWVKLKE